MEAMEVWEQYQVVAAVDVEQLLLAVVELMVLVEPEAVGRYGYGIGKRR